MICAPIHYKQEVLNKDVRDLEHPTDSPAVRESGDVSRLYVAIKRR